MRMGGPTSIWTSWEEADISNIEFISLAKTRGRECSSLRVSCRRLGTAISFLGLGLLGRHGLVDPLIGGFQIGGAGCRISALDIGTFSVHQVHIGHGVVIIGTELERLAQVIDPVLNVCGILSLTSAHTF